MLGPRALGSPGHASELGPLAAHSLREELAVAVGVGRSGRNPLLDVADEGLEPCEDLRFCYVSGDWTGSANSSRFADGGA
jgi:hypothetical protein